MICERCRKRADKSKQPHNCKQPGCTCMHFPAGTCIPVASTAGQGQAPSGLTIVREAGGCTIMLYPDKGAQK